MRTIRVILATLVLLLGLSSISQAVTLSLVSGGFNTSASASQNLDYLPFLPPGLTWQSVHDSDNGQSSSHSLATLSYGDAYAESGAGGSFSSYMLTNDIYSYGHSANHFDVDGGASSSFSFKVLGPDDNSIGNGSILFSWSLTGAFISSHGGTNRGGWPINFSPLMVTVNGVTIIPTQNFSYWPSDLDGTVTGSAEVEVDVAIGDIIWFSSNLSNYLEHFGDDNEIWASLSMDLTAGDFVYSQVPLPPTVWLLGSGLLGLVGWRRFRKG